MILKDGYGFWNSSDKPLSKPNLSTPGNQTLKAVANGIMPFIEEVNQKSYIPIHQLYMHYLYYTINFRTGWCNLPESSTASPQKRSQKPQKANGWEFLMDEEHKHVVFLSPPIITETEKRPDITIYSKRTETIIIIENTQIDRRKYNYVSKKMYACAVL